MPDCPLCRINERCRHGPDSTARVPGDFIKRVTDLGGELAAPSTPEAYGKFVQAETVRWAKVIRDANIKLD